MGFIPGRFYRWQCGTPPRPCSDLIDLEEIDKIKIYEINFYFIYFFDAYSSGYGER
jgi:hypothetical protein